MLRLLYQVFTNLINILLVEICCLHLFLSFAQKKTKGQVQKTSVGETPRSLPKEVHKYAKA
jgi:hypothetical protein